MCSSVREWVDALPRGTKDPETRGTCVTPKGSNYVKELLLLYTKNGNSLGFLSEALDCLTLAITTTIEKPKLESAHTVGALAVAWTTTAMTFHNSSREAQQRSHQHGSQRHGNDVPTKTSMRQFTNLADVILTDPWTGICGWWRQTFIVGYLVLGMCYLETNTESANLVSFLSRCTAALENKDTSTLRFHLRPLLEEFYVGIFNEPYVGRRLILEMTESPWWLGNGKTGSELRRTARLFLYSVLGKESNIDTTLRALATLCRSEAVTVVARLWQNGVAKLLCFKCTIEDVISGTTMELIVPDLELALQSYDVSDYRHLTYNLLIYTQIIMIWKVEDAHSRQFDRASVSLVVPALTRLDWEAILAVVNRGILHMPEDADSLCDSVIGATKAALKLMGAVVERLSYTTVLLASGHLLPICDKLIQYMGDPSLWTKTLQVLGNDYFSLLEKLLHTTLSRRLAEPTVCCTIRALQEMMTSSTHSDSLINSATKRRRIPRSIPTVPVAMALRLINEAIPELAKELCPVRGPPDLVATYDACLLHLAIEVNPKCGFDSSLARSPECSMEMIRALVLQSISCRAESTFFGLIPVPTWRGYREQLTRWSSACTAHQHWLVRAVSTTLSNIHEPNKQTNMIPDPPWQYLNHYHQTFVDATPQTAHIPNSPPVEIISEEKPLQAPLPPMVEDPSCTIKAPPSPSGLPMPVMCDSPTATPEEPKYLDNLLQELREEESREYH